MKNIPLTHYLLIGGLEDRFRYFMFRELAANGAENVVLSEDILKMVGAADSSLLKLSQIKKEVKDAGLKFVDAHSPFGPRLDLNCPLAEERRKLIEVHKLSLACCNECEVSHITIHSGNPRFPGVTLEENRELIRESLEELLPVAERYGVTICIENIWFPTNTPEELIAFCEYFKSPYLGMCYDAGHANLMCRPNDDPSHPANVAFDLLKMPTAWDDKVLEKMLPYLVTCHLHDNDGMSDKHWTPFNGNIDWEKTMKLLAKAPNLRCLQNEVILPGRDLNSSIHDMCLAFDRLVKIYNGN